MEPIRKFENIVNWINKINKLIKEKIAIYKSRGGKLFTKLVTNAALGACTCS